MGPVQLVGMMDSDPQLVFGWEDWQEVELGVLRQGLLD